MVVDLPLVAYVPAATAFLTRPKSQWRILKSHMLPHLINWLCQKCRGRGSGDGTAIAAVIGVTDVTEGADWNQCTFNFYGSGGSRQDV